MTSTKLLNSSISKLPLIGPKYQELLERLEIKKVKDLLYHFPARYEDSREVVKISELSEKIPKTIIVEIVSIKNIRIGGGRTITKAVVTDESGDIEVAWFNQSFITKILTPGKKVIMFGKVKLVKNKLSLTAPQYEIYQEKPSTHLAKLSPIYPETKGISSKWLRARIKPILDMIKNENIILKDPLPAKVRKDEGLIDINDAIIWIHSPKNYENIKKAQERFAFEELYKLIVASNKRKKLKAKTKSPKLDPTSSRLNKLISSLPFELTKSQKESLEMILDDIRKDIPMTRLLQGDTGSGKTIVALGAAIVALDNGYDVILMAPTTILANQHFETVRNLFKKLKIKPILVTSDSKFEKESEASLYIGTHALLFKQEVIDNLGLLIVDEQHRFGVKQRELFVDLKNKEGFRPHYLNMSATPIPRSLALTVFGDTDISVMDKMPKGRQLVETYVVPHHKRDASSEWIKKEILEKGNQLFIVCPLIEESDKLDLKSVKIEFERLSKEIFHEYKLALLHGRMKGEEKDKLLNGFKDKKFDILVSTSVIEVGIDIPNATCIMIEDADHYGLAQLHQMRGRVGRSKFKSYCLLFASNSFDYSDIESKGYQRLAHFSKTHDGMKLAEFDLRLRGPGDFFGIRQSGLPKLKMASIMDVSMLERVGKYKVG